MPNLLDIVSLKPTAYVPPEPTIFVSPTTPHSADEQNCKCMVLPK